MMLLPHETLLFTLAPRSRIDVKIRRTLEAESVNFTRAYTIKTRTSCLRRIVSLPPTMRVERLQTEFIFTPVSVWYLEQYT